MKDYLSNNFKEDNMKKKFFGVYFTAILVMLCTYVPFNLMSVFLSKTHVESLSFYEKMGHSPIWYTFRDISKNLYRTDSGQGYGYIAVIDYKVLIIQITFITLLFIIVFLFLPKKSSDQQENKGVPHT